MAPSYSPISVPRGTAGPSSSKARTTVGGKTVSGHPPGRGKGSLGLGLGKSSKFGAKRHRKVLKDNIDGVTKGDIRRMARRGGVKRISADIYSSMKTALKDYLTKVLNDAVQITSHCNRKTVTVPDVIFALRRQGRPIYGFDNYEDSKKKNLATAQNRK
ncbi:Histone-fold containing protein [Glarea lozoyensis ATCC 20868]|uniref:Histone H4 n=2 Tax=Glarea lozoyensis TaxID=101852 RepID=S3CRT0_GLAL2|nr:Histone-fold containing protein [Glarea lozoyensis ATCC 20868]EHK98725.1 putative Histone H4 [Glarea lozoyensis 74030]EPE28370.1 Histone-fold containing protein [Glarea lozoyensis ATCC 20868]